MSGEWHGDRSNLAAVARYMGERGDTVEDVVYMLEKPHKFEDDWRGAAGMAHTAENDAWDCDHHPEWADRRNVCHHPDHKSRRCPKCDGADLRSTARGRLVCRDCEKRHKRERKDRRHRERGDRCGCGADAVSLNPAEVVLHNWGGGACRVVPIGAIPPGERATGAIVPERQRCICANDVCLDHCRACNHSGRDLEEACIADPDWESDDDSARTIATEENR